MLATRRSQAMSATCSSHSYARKVKRCVNSWIVSSALGPTVDDQVYIDEINGP
jgi:hypothetical protein